MNFEDILENLVRIGTVSAVDAAGKKVRVIFKDRGGITSGWLYVLQHHGASVYVKKNGNHTHDIKDSLSGTGSASVAGEHDHISSVTDWMPEINDQVVVLYLPIFNGDGFVLGAI